MLGSQSQTQPADRQAAAWAAPATPGSTNAHLRLGTGRLMHLTTSSRTTALRTDGTVGRALNDETALPTQRS